MYIIFIYFYIYYIYILHIFYNEILKTINIKYDKYINFNHIISNNQNAYQVIKYLRKWLKTSLILVNVTGQRVK